MAKHEKVLPARRPRTRKGDESVLLQSAEAIGRVIGSLQRQLDGARGRLSDVASNALGAHNNGHGNGNGPAPPRKASKQPAAAERSTTSRPARSRKPAAMKATRAATASRGKKKASHTR